MNPGAPPRRELSAAFAIAAVVVAIHLCFFALDSRPPNDHDDFYTEGAIASVLAFEQAPLLQRPSVLLDHARGDHLHPQLAQMSLVASLGTLGPSRFAYRATNLPWLIVLLLGTWLLARMLSGPRLALLAMWVAGTLPALLNATRKWDIQFHAAALTPLGLALGVAALLSTGRRAALLWIGFGAWQGLRCYTHPVVVPDVLATLGVFALLGLLTSPRAALGALLALVPAFGVSAWYLGVAPGLVGEAPYSFARYLEQRTSFSTSGGLASFDTRALLAHLAGLLRETLHLHLFPPMTMALGAGLAAAPFAALSSMKDPRARAGLGLFALMVVQIPVIVLATANRAFLADWLFLLPTWTVLGLIGLAWAVAGRWDARLPTWAVLLFAFVGFAHAGLPLGKSALGPDPLLRPAEFDRAPWWAFSRSHSGRSYTTMHLAVGGVLASQRVADTLAEQLPHDQPAPLALYDLTWDPSRSGAPGCRMGFPRYPDAWSWAPPGGAGHGRPSTWPFVFAGFPGLRVGGGPRSDFDLPPSGPPVDDQGAPVRFAVVRLWLHPTVLWNDEDRCEPRDRVPDGVVAAAIDRIGERTGRAPAVTVLPDRAATLPGRVVEWERADAYLGVSLLLDFGSAWDRSVDEGSPPPSSSAGQQPELEGDAQLGHPAVPLPLLPDAAELGSEEVLQPQPDPTDAAQGEQLGVDAHDPESTLP